MISAEQNQKAFADFLEQMNAHHPCEACRRSGWIMPAANQGLVLSLSVGLNEGGVVAAARVPAYVLLCSDCGHIRLHARTIVDSKSQEARLLA